MDYKLYKPGQKVTPVTSKKYVQISGPSDNGQALKFGEVYTVAGYDPVPDAQGCLYVILEEKPKDASFDQHTLAPVVGDDVLAGDLKEIFNG